MSFSEGALMIGLLVLFIGGGYGLYLKHQAELDRRAGEHNFKTPPAE